MKPNLKTIPWMAAMQATMVVTDHLRRIDPKDRSKALKTLLPFTALLKPT